MTLEGVLIVLFVVLLVIGIRRSPMFLILSSLVLLILANLINDTYLATEPDLTRYGTFVIFIIASVLLFVQGALNLPDEFKKKV